jgi:hypothetical protein
MEASFWIPVVSEPDQGKRRVAVDRVHDGDLLGSLLLAVLVDAEGIGQDDASGVLTPYMVECLAQVR